MDTSRRSKPPPQPRPKWKQRPPKPLDLNGLDYYAVNFIADSSRRRSTRRIRRRRFRPSPAPERAVELSKSIMASGRHRDVGEREHREAFGGNSGIYESCRERIDQIKSNDPDLDEFWLDQDAAGQFSDLAWELLGRYIADNVHLESICLRDLRLRDSKAALLFRGLARGSTVKALDLDGNRFGLKGVRSMVPFLENSRNINELKISDNANINTDCFELMIKALHGGSIRDLRMVQCNIDSISAFENHALPSLTDLCLDGNIIHNISELEKLTNLRHLDLGGNPIGKEGCGVVSNLLKNNDSSLKRLRLAFTGIGDDEAETIAASLKNNISLTSLVLDGNRIKENGYRAFLRLLNDVSSIDRTYNSNHTLKYLYFSPNRSQEMKNLNSHIISAMEVNRYGRYTIDSVRHTAGREKVIQTQLKRDRRKELCRLQGINCSYGKLLDEFEPVLLPEVLTMIGGKHGRNELFCALVAIAPEFPFIFRSIINRKAVLKQRMAENEAKIATVAAQHVRDVATLDDEYARRAAALASRKFRRTVALTTDNLELKRELESIESGRGDQSRVLNTSLVPVAKLSGKKRGRSTSF